LSKPVSTAHPDLSSFERRIGELRSQLTGVDPYVLADRTGSHFIRLGGESGQFDLELWHSPVTLSFPDFQAYQANSDQALPAFNTALLLYYFVTADGSPLTGKWISFTELPDGRFYTQAFQGYSGNELTRSFHNNLDAFKTTAELLGGRPLSLGDASYVFQALPRIPILVVSWLGDEEFPSSFKILFDASAPHYLPTDAYAILGSNITRRLISTLSTAR
jgi:hypothetical protein